MEIYSNNCNLYNCKVNENNNSHTNIADLIYKLHMFSYNVCNTKMMDWNFVYNVYLYGMSLNDILDKQSSNFIYDFSNYISPFKKNLELLERFLRYQDLENMINYFLSEYYKYQILTPEQFKNCKEAYDEIYFRIKSIDCYFLEFFENLCQTFLLLYTNLYKNIDWNEFNSKLSKILEQKKYFSLNDFKLIEKQYTDYLLLYNDLTPFMPGDLLVKFQNSKQFIDTLSYQRKQYNEFFVNSMLKQTHYLLSNIDGKCLDFQQRQAVIYDEDEMLIVAGAGSGKTLTIAAKVKYLVDVCNINPSNILLISYTKNSQKEMAERINNRLGLNVEVKTFHKLGLEIIANYTGYSKSIIDNNYLYSLIENYLVDNIFPHQQKTDLISTHFKDKFYAKLTNLQENQTLKQYYYNIMKLEYKEFLKIYDDNIEDFIDNISNFDEKTKKYKTLNGEYVKSKEEAKIANFLFLHGIRYEYESSYQFFTADLDYVQYKPDFFLPDNHIYIEHFAINENEDVSDVIEDKVAYKKGISWKRGTHAKYQTLLIETYSYQERNNTLLTNLKQNLEGYNILFNKLDKESILNQLIKHARFNYDQFTEFIHKFISLFKSRGNKIDDIKNMYHNETEERKKFFYGIIEEIYQIYNDNLEKKSSIDFTDMIYHAIDIIDNEINNINSSTDLLHFKYEYIIVDEYQDISNEKKLLIDKLKKFGNSKVFYVGDDWQAIYRFSGSDIGIFTATSKTSMLLKIENTYRNPQSMINIAGQFIMKNKQQIEKTLISKSQVYVKEPTIEMYEYYYDKNPVRSNIINALKGALDNIVSTYGDEEEIFLLGRYNRDYNNVKSLFNGQESGGGKNLIPYSTYPKLKIRFLTVHSSKGLECDHVIILNAIDGLLGFPCKIEDDPIMLPYLPDKEEYQYAEERRLFYVALTRAKKKCIILTPQSKPSIFIKELTDLGVQKTHYFNHKI